MFDQTLLLIVALLVALLIPFFKWMTTALIFRMNPIFLTTLRKAVSFSAFMKVLIVSCLSVMISRSKVGREKMFRNKLPPCGERAKRWNSPKTDNPSFAVTLAREGP